MTRTGRCLLWVALCGSPAAAEDLAQILSFEGPHAGTFLRGWGGAPPGTLFVDGEIVHAGDFAARIERGDSSEGGFSTLTKVLPMAFEGEKIELRGFLRTEEVAGYAGLWLRQDGESPNLEFDNMAGRGPSGTTEWTEYRIELPLSPEANRLIFGVLLAGRGKAWADSLELRIDGVPYLGPPEHTRLRATLVEDREFDNGSGIEVEELSASQTEAHFVLAKVWGFLNYHHPKIAGGQIHWDYELLRAVRRALDEPEPPRLATEEWIDRIGDPPACTRCASPPIDPHLRAEVEWIADASGLGPELSAFLQRVYRDRYSGGVQAYVQQTGGAGNADFATENDYSTLARVDAGYRILALARLWSMVQYWFPYRDLIDDDWDEALREFLPRVVAAVDRESYAVEIMALVSRLRDTHANLWSSLDVRPPRGECWLPLELRFIERRAVVVGVVAEAGETGARPHVGDVLEAIDGTDIAAMVSAWEPLYAASNRPTRLRDIARFLPRGPCEDVHLELDRDGERIGLTSRRVPGELPGRQNHNRPGDTYQRLSADVAYLSLATIENGQAAGYIAQASGARGLVVDIRNYPGAFVVFELGNRLVTEPTPFARFTRADPANPGAFSWTDPLVLRPATPHFGGRVVILVDEITQSQAEYTAMALRAAPDALVVGSTTAGADGNVSSIPLPGGLRAMISGIGVYYPDKTPTQRVGIVPDVVVRPTREGILEGRDEVLEEGLRQILGSSAEEEVVRRMALH